MRWTYCEDCIFWREWRNARLECASGRVKVVRFDDGRIVEQYGSAECHRRCADDGTPNQTASGAGCGEGQRRRPSRAGKGVKR
jgi:hypothetical protein